METSQEYIVRAVANPCKVWPRFKKEDDERKRRRRGKSVLDYLLEDPEDALELSNERPPTVQEKKRAVLATAESLVRFSMFCCKRKATFEEQVLAVALSPGCGCPGGPCQESFPPQLPRA